MAIIYFSHTGNNEKLALYLKERLKCSVHKIMEAKKRKTISILLDFLFGRDTKLLASDIDLDDYDMIVFISPIWGSKIATPLRKFICNKKGNIKKFSFISLCNGEIGQVEKLISELSNIAQKTPITCTELKINRLLPEEKRKIKYTFNYRVSDDDIKFFDDDINDFVRSIEDC